MDKHAIKKARSAAVSLKIHLDDGDSVRQMLSRESGLFFVTGNKIVGRAVKACRCRPAIGPCGLDRGRPVAVRPAARPPARGRSGNGQRL